MCWEITQHANPILQTNPLGFMFSWSLLLRKTGVISCFEDYPYITYSNSLPHPKSPSWQFGLIDSQVLNLETLHSWPQLIKPGISSKVKNTNLQASYEENQQPMRWVTQEFCPRTLYVGQWLPNPVRFSLRKCEWETHRKTRTEKGAWSSSCL